MRRRCKSALNCWRRVGISSNSYSPPRRSTCSRAGGEKPSASASSPSSRPSRRANRSRTTQPARGYFFARALEARAVRTRFAAFVGRLAAVFFLHLRAAADRGAARRSGFVFFAVFFTFTARFADFGLAAFAAAFFLLETDVFFVLVARVFLVFCADVPRSEEHTSELQSRENIV